MFKPLLSLVAALVLHPMSAVPQVEAPGPNPSKPSLAPGTFPEHWIDGTDCANERPIQVHAYSAGFYILRQSKCSSYEAPFLFLILGEFRALLLDTGATGNPPVFRTVESIVSAWKREHSLTEYELIVAHTHAHPDHIANDAQFAGKPDTFVVAPGLASVFGFFGFQDYPHDAVTFDLGGRVLDVLGIPGHESSCIAVYDRVTGLLLTGDSVYPGHLFVFAPNNWNDFVASTRRLVAFAEANPVSFVLGCHVEMTNTPGVPYPYGTTAQPDEHPLELSPSVLPELLAKLLAMGSSPTCSVEAEYVIHPVFACGIGF